jgi:hypothetical protein
MITEENVLQALFGPDLGQVIDSITISRKPEETPHYDHIEIRRRSRETSLYGRYGTIRGRPVLMLWHLNDGWEPMLNDVITLLQVSDDTILTVGHEEMGTIGDFKGHRLSG